MTEAIAIFRSGGSEASEERQRYLGEPLTSGCFKDAHDLWLTEYQTNSGDTVSRIIDPGFELEINLHEPGFGWRTTGKAPTPALALEVASPCAGRHSLRVEFNGESDPAPPIISQLVLVEPHTRYQLHLAVRTKGLVSGGLPPVVVVDAGATNILDRPLDYLSQPAIGKSMPWISIRATPPPYRSICNGETPVNLPALSSAGFGWTTSSFRSCEPST